MADDIVEQRFSVRHTACFVPRGSMSFGRSI
jgi:hypothetical protein